MRGSPWQVPLRFKTLNFSEVPLKFATDIIKNKVTPYTSHHVYSSPVGISEATFILLSFCSTCSMQQQSVTITFENEKIIIGSGKCCDPSCDRVSDDNKSCHICSLRLYVANEKYMTLSMIFTFFRNQR